MDTSVAVPTPIYPAINSSVLDSPKWESGRGWMPNGDEVQQKEEEWAWLHSCYLLIDVFCLLLWFVRWCPTGLLDNVYPWTSYPEAYTHRPRDIEGVEVDTEDVRPSFVCRQSQKDWRFGCRGRQTESFKCCLSHHHKQPTTTSSRRSHGDVPWKKREIGLCKTEDNGISVNSWKCRKFVTQLNERTFFFCCTFLSSTSCTSSIA